MRGFTFIEVLVAMFIMAVLSGVLCAVLTQVAVVERRTARVREARLHWQTLWRRLNTHAQPEDDLLDTLKEAFAPDWQVACETRNQDQAPAWIYWVLESRTEPGADFGAWIRSDLPPW
jgi:prepilin-type N-terminal cleavage/methylation domain-containing protein